MMPEANNGKTVASLTARVHELQARLSERNTELDVLRSTLGSDVVQSALDQVVAERENRLTQQAAIVTELKSRGFEHETHRKFALTVDQDQNTFAYCATEHLRIQGVFWTLGCMDLLGSIHELPVNEIVEFSMSCYHENVGGFGGNIGHDAHILYTQHAIYVLAQCDALERVDVDKVATYIGSLQNEDGSFRGDEWGEVDTRFSYCALATLAVLHRMDAIDLQKAMEFILTCRNFDGGFGSTPGAESHAGYIFTAVGALSIGGGLNLISSAEWDKLAWWLSERQCDSGGLNGRPEKQADVCYSWWVLSALHILGRLDWIDQKKLIDFILKCQDPHGGVADRPGDVADVYHTFFGICGLSLLGFLDSAHKGVNNGVHNANVVRNGVNNKVVLLGNAVDPIFALPKHTMAALGLSPQILHHKEL